MAVKASCLNVVCIDGVCPVCEFGEFLLGPSILCISHTIITRLALEPFECILTALVACLCWMRQPRTFGSKVGLLVVTFESTG